MQRCQQIRTAHSFNYLHFPGSFGTKTNNKWIIYTKACVYICLKVYIYTHTHIYIYMGVFMCLQVYICILYRCVYICTYTTYRYTAHRLCVPIGQITTYMHIDENINQMYKYMSLCVCACVYLCIYACMCITRIHSSKKV